MNTGCSEGLLAELAQVREELVAWRASAGKGRKIPDAVWRKATCAARRHGLNPVSKALGLDYNCLKRRVVGDGGGENTRPGMMPAFVEVKTEALAAVVGCVIELEKGSGTRMRICVQSASSVDWGRIKEAFLGA